jgi:hypothetical protein
VGDPGARAGAHDRLQRRHQAAGRALHLDALAMTLVDVGFAVGDHDHILAAQFAAQDGAQRLGRPGDLRFVARTMLGLQFAHQACDVARDRAELGQVHGRGCRRIAQQAFAAQQRAHPGDPAAPRQLGDDHGQQRDEGGEAEKGIHQIALGLLAAAGDEAEVVHQDQRPSDRRLVIGCTETCNSALLAGEQLPRAHRPAAEVLAAQLGGQRLAGYRGAIAAGTEADGVEAFVEGDAGEEVADLGLAPCCELFEQRLADGVGDQLRADVDVAHEPAQRHLVDQRRDGVGEGREHQHQGMMNRSERRMAANDERESRYVAAAFDRCRRCSLQRTRFRYQD